MTARDLGAYELFRRFRVKYESGECEIWLVRTAHGRVRAAKMLDEWPCYALAPWRRSP